MAIPSPIKIKKDGVEFISNVDRVQYSLANLCRAALYDTAKLIRKRMLQKLKTLPGMKRSRRPYRAAKYKIPYWEKGSNPALAIGFSHDSWYAAHQELGTSRQPKRSILRDTVLENIDDIQRIQGKYLSAIEDENRALGLIKESDYDSPDGEE